MINTDIYLSMLSGFTASLNAMRLYPVRHPQTQGAVDRCFGALEKLFQSESEIAMLVMDDTVFFNGRPLPGAGPSGGALSMLMRRKGVDRLIFKKGLTKEQLVDFLKNLSSKETTVVYAQSHIQLGKIVLDQGGRTEAGTAVGTAAAPSSPRLSDLAAGDLKSLYDAIQRNRTVSGAKLNGFAADFVRTFNEASQPLTYLADIKTEDEYTYVHTINVALLTVGFASWLGIDGKARSDIACAALMHDVGKMFVPDEILNKRGALDAGERAVMELHPVRGALYLGRIGGLPRLSNVVALEHHIKYDGTGYPNLGAGRKPHWVSQMVSIADVFDALRSSRPYRDSLEQERVLDILRQEVGTALNPDLTNRFIAMVRSA